MNTETTVVEQAEIAIEPVLILDDDLQMVGGGSLVNFY